MRSRGTRVVLNRNEERNDGENIATGKPGDSRRRVAAEAQRPRQMWLMTIFGYTVLRGAVFVPLAGAGERLCVRLLWSKSTMRRRGTHVFSARENAKQLVCVFTFAQILIHVAYTKKKHTRNYNC